MVRFLAIDPALNNFGLARGYLNGTKVEIDAIKLISTKNTASQQKNLADARRIKKIRAEILSFSTDHQIVLAEIPGGSKSYKAAWSLGIALAVVVTLDNPTIFVTPLEVKKSIGQYAKVDIIKWAVSNYPHLDWLRYQNNKLRRNNEHCADAIAIAVAGLRKYKATNKVDL